jgi:uncharacterized protein YaiE (UPF0345 family)
MYFYTTFGALTLPTAAPTQDVGAGSVDAPVISLPGGGVYDPYGNEIIPRKGQKVTVQGAFTGANVAAREALAVAAYPLLGTRGTLSRVPDATARTETIQARLIDLSFSRTADHNRHWPYSFTFLLLERCWSGAAESPSVALDASPKNLACPNAGNVRVTNPVVTITAQTSTITSVTVAVTGVSSWTYTGGIAAGESLVVDCGALTVENNGSDDYAHFALGAAHAIDDWLRIEPGGTTIRVTKTGGGATSTVALSYKDGWA